MSMVKEALNLGGQLANTTAPEWLELHGAKFCRVYPNDKKPIGQGWQDNPLTWAEVKQHVAQGGNVGLICGQHSGGILLVDIDDRLGDFLTTFPSWANYPRIERGHPGKAKFVLRLTDGWQGEKKYKKTPQDKHPFLEILWTGNQGVIPPSRHPEGGLYSCANLGGDIPTLTAAALTSVVNTWAEIYRHPTPTGDQTPSLAERAEHDNGGGPELREAVRAYWTPLKVFERFGLAANGTKKEQNWTRVFGNGGLFVHNDGLTWARPGDGKGAGGDVFDAWHFCETNGQAYKIPPAEFRKTLVAMAQAAGIVVPTSGDRKKTPPAASQAQPSTPGQAVAKKTPPDDSTLAARWLATQPLTAWGMGDFRRYEGGIWAAVDRDGIRKEIKRILDNARPEGLRATSGRLESVLELARVDIAVKADTWDANIDYLICKNGALYIPTRKLTPHDPGLYATSGLDFDYDPNAQAPVFMAALKKSIPAAADFVQEFAGYSLTADTSHEIALWFYGPPGSGRSTILAGLQAMLGARAGLLGLADIERSRFALNNLPGKTLVISTEQPDSYISATHILNALISGEPLTVEQKFRDAVNIIPRAKVAWAMNDYPRVNGANNGIMRRVKVVKFPALAEAERDPTVKERIKTEGAGILNWALDGLVRLRNRGRFITPPCVEDATKEFRDTNDIPALFLSETGALLGPDYKTGGQQLYDSYREWCLRTGHKPASSTSIADDWRRLGFEGYKAAGRKFWRGVGLVTQPPEGASD